MSKNRKIVIVICIVLLLLAIACGIPLYKVLTQLNIDDDQDGKEISDINYDSSPVEVVVKTFNDSGKISAFDTTPDGRYLYFSEYDGSGVTRIYKHDLGSGSTTQILNQFERLGLIAVIDNQKLLIADYNVAGRIWNDIVMMDPSGNQIERYVSVEDKSQRDLICSKAASNPTGYYYILADLSYKSFDVAQVVDRVNGEYISLCPEIKDKLEDEQFRMSILRNSLIETTTLSHQYERERNSSKVVVEQGDGMPKFTREEWSLRSYEGQCIDQKALVKLGDKQVFYDDGCTGTVFGFVASNRFGKQLYFLYTHERNAIYRIVE